MTVNGRNGLINMTSNVKHDSCVVSGNLRYFFS